MIHVAFCTSNLYSKFAGTAILSMFENTSASPRSIIVHILHDNTLSADNRDKFSYIAGMYGQTVKFYNVEELCADKIDEIKQLIPAITNSVFTIGTFYRFFTAQLLSNIEKAIYLDSDIIVNLDIEELWKIELGDKILAAGAEKEVDNTGYKIEPPRHYLVASGMVDRENYFVAGLMMINLSQMRNREKIILDGIKFYYTHPQCKYFDQDILNWCFAKDYVHLPIKFGAFVSVERIMGRNSVVQRAIYHYAGSILGLNIGDIFNRLWMKYFAKTPWFNEETIGHLYEGIRQLYVEQKNFATQISALVSGKTRAFFVQPNMVDAARQIFYVKPEEEIIAADSPESLQKLIDAMKKAGGAKVFFVLVGDYLSIAHPLLQAGFVEGRDFLNAMLFLSDANGLPLNSYSLVKLL